MPPPQGSHFREVPLSDPGASLAQPRTATLRGCASSPLVHERPTHGGRPGTTLRHLGVRHPHEHTPQRTTRANLGATHSLWLLLVKPYARNENDQHRALPVFWGLTACKSSD